MRWSRRPARPPPEPHLRDDRETSKARSATGSDLRFWELAPGLEPGTCCLQDRRGSSTAYWRVLSLQVKSGGSSRQCAPVGPSNAWWNDKRNDVLDLHIRVLGPKDALKDDLYRAPRGRADRGRTVHSIYCRMRMSSSCTRAASWLRPIVLSSISKVRSAVVRSGRKASGVASASRR
jgi:hypothetical protein